MTWRKGVCRRTDARSITTTYTYDALNRLTEKSFSDSTPAAYFFYDESSFTLNGTNYTLTNAKGRLSHTVTGSTSSPSTATIHSYDAMGRTVDQWQCSPYNCASATIWNLHYNYDLAGDIGSWKDAGSTTFTQTISNAQRVTGITSSLSDSTHPGTLASSITYDPAGQMTQFLDGCVGTGCTQEQETYDYNDRLQVVRIQLGTSSTPASNNCRVYNYYGNVANPTSCAVPSQGTGDDGSVMGQYFQDSTNSSLGHTSSYSYDAVNRLTNSAATGSATENLTYSYDQYGNMTCTTNANTNGPCPSVTFTSSTNQIYQIGSASAGYDAAGDMTSDGLHTYQWDAEQRMISVDSGSTASYLYNALGERVEKHAGTNYTEYIFNPQEIQADASDRSTSCCAWEYLFFGARRFGKYASNETYFSHADKIHTMGTVTDYTGRWCRTRFTIRGGRNGRWRGR